jgi:prolycopene isomerase
MDRADAPQHAAYDVVIVGSGMGGLTAGALLARAGRRVLIAERATAAGGYAHAFKRGPYTFDPGVRWVGDPTLFNRLLDFLEVADRCNLLLVEPFYTAVFPGFRLDVPLGQEAYLEAHVRHFPHQAAAFRRYLDLCYRIHWEAHQLPPRLTMAGLDEATRKYPTVFKYIRATLQEVLDDCLTDPRLKALCTAPWPYVGSPPRRLSFLSYAQFLFAHIEQVFYCQGSFENLVQALVTALTRRGGELVLGNGVSHILIEDGRAVGVELAGGQIVRASAVISNADATQTFETLVGVDHLPTRFVRNFRKLTPSLSAFSVYAVTTMDLVALNGGHPVHEFFYYKSWDHDETWRQILAGQPWGMFMATPSVVDPHLAPPGQHIISATAPVPYDIGTPWNDARARYTELVLDEIEAVFPGTRKTLVFTESATPLTLEAYTSNLKGAIVGWENTPEQMSSRRPALQTPIPGLYLAGHWTHPGGSILRAAVSGIHTTQLVLEDSGQVAAGAIFAPPDLPPLA